jgi:HK97 family phage portal protein
VDFARLASDGTAGGTHLRAPEERSVAGEELWWPPGVGSAGIYVTESTALRLPAILASINVLATDVAALPLCVHQRQADGGRRDADEHPVSILWGRSPNGETTPFRWRQAWLAHALQYGNGYGEIVRTGRGAPTAFHLLDPRTTEPKRVDGRLGYSIEGGRRWIEAANVLHIAGLGLDGLTGYSFVKLMRQSIGLGIASETYAADYFANGADPGGVIETPQKLSREAKESLRDGWEMRHRGAGNHHRTAVLEQGSKYNQIGSDPEKSQLVETRKFQVVDAIRPWRVPPHKAGDFSEAHLANIDASNLDYLMTALIGWLETIEQECNLKLFTLAEYKAGYYVEHNVNALLRGDIKSRFECYALAIDKGWMNRDEVRARENMNPIGKDAGGDKFLVQMQYTTLETAGVPVPEKSPVTVNLQSGKEEPKAPETPDNVQTTALNGGQIASLMQIVKAAANEELPPETAKAMIAASFPTLTPAEIDAILNPLEDFEPEEPGEPPPPPAPPEPQEPTEPAPGKEEPDPDDA